MKNTKNSYYFEYNVYENIFTGITLLNEDFTRNHDIFLCVAHIEEYYKSYENDEASAYHDSLDNLKHVMTRISKKELY